MDKVWLLIMEEQEIVDNWSPELIGVTLMGAFKTKESAINGIREEDIAGILGVDSININKIRRDLEKKEVSTSFYGNSPRYQCELSLYEEKLQE